MNNAVDLMSNATGNGAFKQWNGGRTALIAVGTWGGGNVKLQVQASDPSSTAVDVPNSTVSANGMIVVDLPIGQVRAVATTATGVYARLVTIPGN